MHFGLNRPSCFSVLPCHSDMFGHSVYLVTGGASADFFNSSVVADGKMFN